MPFPLSWRLSPAISAVQVLLAVWTIWFMGRKKLLRRNQNHHEHHTYRDLFPDNLLVLATSSGDTPSYR
ncbi:hypothetical protein ACLK1T_09410 [Escherichia coli]